MIGRICTAVIATTLVSSLSGQNAEAKDYHHHHHKHHHRHARFDSHAPGWATGPKGYGYRTWNGRDWTWDYNRHR